MKNLDRVSNVNKFKSLEDEASWIRNDIKSTDLEDKIKNLLLSLSDEDLVKRINKAEDKIILKKLENREQTGPNNLKSYTLDDVKEYIKSRRKK